MKIVVLTGSSSRDIQDKINSLLVYNEYELIGNVRLSTCIATGHVEERYCATLKEISEEK